MAVLITSDQRVSQLIGNVTISASGRRPCIIDVVLDAVDSSVWHTGYNVGYFGDTTNYDLSEISIHNNGSEALRYEYTDDTKTFSGTVAAGSNSGILPPSGQGYLDDESAELYIYYANQYNNSSSRRAVYGASV